VVEYVCIFGNVAWSMVAVIKGGLVCAQGQDVTMIALTRIINVWSGSSTTNLSRPWLCSLVGRRI
jgi:hypothetical protein